MVEVKKKKHFNDRSTCQLIGYYLASRADVATNNPTHPPLCLLICENLIKFAFFPFLLRNGSPCIEGIVTPEIPLFHGVTLNEKWFTFICYYINHLLEDDRTLHYFKPEQDCLTFTHTDGSVVRLNLHAKKTYNNIMEPNQDAIAALEAELEEKDAKLEEKDAKLQEKDAKLQEKDAKLQEKDALIEQLQKRLTEVEEVQESMHHQSKRQKL